jgi:NAD(P)-dependent dehydrogenase (short-subunit alcohol dehydrogenase family)
MSDLLSGKVAFVSGGGSGIGRATALMLAQDGARVLVTDLVGAQETAAAIVAEGSDAYSVTLDVTDEVAVNAAIDGLVGRWGRIDVGFNNAGISIEKNSDAWCDLHRYDRTVAVNQRGVLLCMIAQLRHMTRQQAGSIINTASVAGLSGIGAPGYVASKHAVLGLTRAAALRYAKEGIRVNAICPGATETGMMSARHDAESRRAKAAIAPMNRIADPSEMAGTVAFLASDRASFITGQAIAIDGGFMIW